MPSTLSDSMGGAWSRLRHQLVSGRSGGVAQQTVRASDQAVHTGSFHAGRAWAVRLTIAALRARAPTASWRRHALADSRG
jgi:hypothetical protein